MAVEGFEHYAPPIGAVVLGGLAVRASITGVYAPRRTESIREDHPVRYWLHVGFLIVVALVRVGLHFEPELFEPSR